MMHQGGSYAERGAVPAEHGPVQRGDPVSGPEVQVGSSAAEHLDQVPAALQLDRQRQGTLWDPDPTQS